MLDVYTPYPYQGETIELMKKHKAFAVFADMGLGKTVMTLQTIYDLAFEACEVHRVLILSPLRVTKFTWPGELDKWAFADRLTYAVCHGKSKKEVIQSTSHEVDITLLNYDGLKYFRKYGKYIPPYDMLIIDESTFVKNQETIRWDIVSSLARLIPRRILLTGTPAPNSLLDLWAQMYMLDYGERLGTSYYHYRNKYFTKDEYSRRWHLRRGAKEKIHTAIADLCIVLKAEDHLDMPELHNNKLSIRLPPKLQAQYEEFEDDMFIQLGDAGIEAFNMAALSMKLRQFISGFMYDEEKNAHFIHNERLNVLKELIESLNGTPLLVAVQFREEVDMIREALGYKVPAFYTKTTAKEEVIYFKGWNAGTIPVLLAHPASISHGLNLQHGGCNMLWYSQTWSLEHLQQMIARLWRNGQNNKVVNNFIIAEGTVDEVIFAAVAAKDATQRELLDRIQKWRKDHS